MARVGARSLRGAMGTYALTAAVAVLLLALVLWLGPWDRAGRPSVLLDPAGPWVEGTLDDGTRVWELVPGVALELPPGSYRLTLFDGAGASRQRRLELVDGPLSLGATGDGLSADPGAAR